MRNHIPAMQQAPELVALLRARFRTYRSAKRTQALFVTFAIGLPMASAFLAPTYPDLKPFLAVTSLLLLLLDTGLVERIQKERLKRGARLQEEFDVEVLGLNWNQSLSGSKVDHEDVRAASAKPLSKKRESQLIPWYEPCVGAVPLHLGRLICQRTNISYDGRLRRTYASFLLGAAIVLGIALALLGISRGLTVSELLVAVTLPCLPLFAWALREHFKQAETASALTTLKSQFETLWKQAMAGEAIAELERGSRELQDSIFRHRASSPLVFDWVYDRLRNSNEDEARHAAECLVAEVKNKLLQEVRHEAA